MVAEVVWWLGLTGISATCLYYSESSYKNFSHSVQKCKKELIKAPFNHQNEGKFVYAAEKLQTSSTDPLKDDLFSVSLAGLKLFRKVEMFQYFLNKHKQIETSWFDKPMSSKGLPKGYENPSWKVKNFTAKTRGMLSVNDYMLEDHVLDKLNPIKWEECNYTEDDFKQIKADGGLVLYKHGTYKRPFVGCYRITHEFIPVGTAISIIGLQKSGKIVPFAGLYLIKAGKIESEELIRELEKMQLERIWKTRIFFGLFAAIGVIGVCKTLKELIDNRNKH
jgi:hypothetical protein